MRAIADTGFLVAAMNRKDRFHSWAAAFEQQVTEPLLTCEAVLAETAFHIHDVARTLELVETGFVRIALDVEQEGVRLTKLSQRYADRFPDLADICLIRLSELYPQHSVLTIDVTDFRVYRRNQREVIPLIHPPDL